MNPNEMPPSFSSSGGAIRDISFNVGTIPNAQRVTDHNQGKSIKGEYGGEQAPSVGDMRQVILSTPFGDPYNRDGQPPSLNDVARRDASQTGSSYPAGNQASVPQPGMSLTGKIFKDYHPDAFSKD